MVTVAVVVAIVIVLVGVGRGGVAVEGDSCAPRIYLPVLYGGRLHREHVGWLMVWSLRAVVVVVVVLAWLLVMRVGVSCLSRLLVIHRL